MKPKPLPRLTPSQVARFWSIVDRRGPNECWPWKGEFTTTKYSESIRYGLWIVNGRGIRPHRVAYTLCKGPIPDGLTLDHVKARGCTDTLCCNPDHLEPATMGEQVRRRDSHKNVAPGLSRCKWGHVRPIGTKAHCRECSKMHNARFRVRHPERFSVTEVIAAQQYLDHLTASSAGKPPLRESPPVGVNSNGAVRADVAALNPTAPLALEGP